MEFNTVFDISSIIWEEDKFDANSHQYYKLLYGVSVLFGKFSNEKPNILMRKELSFQMMSSFPFEKIKNLKKYNNDFWDIGMLVYSFLGKINLSSIIFPAHSISDIGSKPNLIKDYFTLPIDPINLQYILFGVLIILVLLYRPQGLLKESEIKTKALRAARARGNTAKNREG